jgi:hypothetical protein
MRVFVTESPVGGGVIEVEEVEEVDEVVIKGVLNAVAASTTLPSNTDPPICGNSAYVNWCHPISH